MNLRIVSNELTRTTTAACAPGAAWYCYFFGYASPAKLVEEEAHDC